jgi:regulator of sigma E protease
MEYANYSLQNNDVILEIEGRKIYMSTDIVDVLNGKKKGDVVTVKVLRDGKEKTVKVTLLKDLKFDSMADSAVPVLNALGIDGLEPTRQKQSFFDGLGHSFAYSWRLGGSILRSLGELVTGKLSITSMGGPVTTISVTADAASSGWLSFLNIAAFIGVNLAVFNLLPIPALDGCKVIFCIIEWIRKKPVSRKVETIIHFVGIIALFGFAILVDLLHFII